MKKTFVLVLAMSLILGLVACGNSPASTSSKVVSQSEATNKIPVLLGSDALSMAESIKNEFGISYTEHSDDEGIQYSFSDMDSTGISGDIWSNLNNEIISIVFLNMKGNPDILVFVAGVNYNTAMPEEAQGWVQENVGSKATTSFGGANFSTRINDSNGAISILVEADGLEEYYANNP